MSGIFGLFLVPFGYKSELVEKGYFIDGIRNEGHVDTSKVIVNSIFILLL